jgi:hypothetical protein
MFPRLMNVHCDWGSTAHTKCRNETKDLKRSAELCSRAVADNVKEAGKLVGVGDLKSFAYCSREVLCRALELELRLHS